MIINGLHKKTVKKNMTLLFSTFIGKNYNKVGLGFVISPSLFEYRLTIEKLHYFCLSGSNIGDINILIETATLLTKYQHVEHGGLEIISGICVLEKHGNQTSNKENIYLAWFFSFFQRNITFG